MTVHGRQAHIGPMHQGRNAFDDAIRVVGALPGPLSVAHGPREFVRIDRLVECAAIYARTAAPVLAPP